jgi:4-aminobutyrate aminotransferase-like enzyme
VRQTQGTGIRVFPALTITREELDEGLTLIEESIAAVAG